MEKIENNAKSILSQFLQGIPLSKESCKNFLKGNQFDIMESQRQLLGLTVHNELCRKHSISVKHQCRVLRTIIQVLEEEKCEIIDDMFVRLTHLLAGPDHQEYLDKVFLLNSFPGTTEKYVVIREKQEDISRGTTGLKSWCAAKVLANSYYSSTHVPRLPDISGKSVWELGSGVGLLGLLLAHVTNSGTYIFTDCHPHVLHALRKNITRNCDRCKRLSEECDAHCIGNTQLWSEHLDWTAAASQVPQLIEKHGAPDVLISTDTVYDPQLFQPLINTIQVILHAAPAAATLLVYVVRNEETLSQFKRAIDQAEIHHVSQPAAPSTSYPVQVPLQERVEYSWLSLKK